MRSLSTMTTSPGSCSYARCMAWVSRASMMQEARPTAWPLPPSANRIWRSSTSTLALGPQASISGTVAPSAMVGGRRLSDNQVEIMRLVAEGFSNAEIGRRRHLTDAAVEKAIARLIKQLELQPGRNDNPRVLVTQAYFALIGSTQVRRD